MTETIQQLKEDIAILQMKLQKLEEIEKQPRMNLQQEGEYAVVSYHDKTYYRLENKTTFSWYIKKDVSEYHIHYRSPNLVMVNDAETERLLEGLYYNYIHVKKEKEQKWDVVRESVKWCEEHPDESVEEYLKPHTPEKTEQLLREAFKKVQQTEEWKETQRKIDSNYDEMVESGTEPPEPTSTVFRQKLFDGIKSVFYDPDYERTHWKLKVDMAVDEVLTHFYDIIPEPFEKELQDDFEKGWNSCLKSIEIYMEFGDD